MKKFLILVAILSQFIAPANALIVQVDAAQNYTPVNAKNVNTSYPVELNKGEGMLTRQAGAYMDGRGQVPEYSRIAPPNEDKIPQAHPTKTVVPWEPYYDRNKLGYREGRWETRRVPNYNAWYSTRRNKPYTRQEYMEVWCTGTADYEKGVCTQGDMNVYFFRARDWAWGVSAAPWRNLGKHKKWAVFLCVDELGLDAPYMYDAKQWAEFLNIPLFMGTIDSYIPLNWIL